MTHDSIEFYSVYKSRGVTDRGRSCQGRKRRGTVRARDRVQRGRMHISRLLIRCGRALFKAGMRLAGHNALYGLEEGRAIYE